MRADVTLAAARLVNRAAPTVEEVAAITLYEERQARRHHPAGRTDNGGRWYPSDTERRPCCERVQSPTRGFPWSLMLHCRTLRHVANRTGVPEHRLRHLLAILDVGLKERSTA